MRRIDISPSVVPSRERDGRLHPARSLWRYLEAHHAKFGVALFVVPVALGAFLFTEAAYALSWLVG